MFKIVPRPRTPFFVKTQEVGLHTVFEVYDMLVLFFVVISWV